MIDSSPAPVPPETPCATGDVARLRAVLGVATVVMLVLSWPLWITTDAFPRVPFTPGLPEVPAAGSWTLFALLLAALALAAVGIAWKTALGGAIGILTFLVLEDQHRFQPWVYQFVMVGLVLAAMPPAQALRYARWWFAGLYLHSGLSKLDLSFCREMGNLFLTTALRPAGVDPSGWPSHWRTAAILAMPAAEILMAAALVIRRTRRIGLVGILALHAALLEILGPWGLRHSTIVIVWNVAMMVEATVLFWPRRMRTAPGLDDSTLLDSGRAWLLPSLATARQEPRPPGNRNTHLRTALEARFLRGKWVSARVLSGTFAALVTALFWAAVIAPLGERWGWLDAWPAHALYASHVERTWVELNPEEDAWPNELAPFTTSRGLSDGAPFDLTRWSLAVRGVPVYPQARACNGLAEALAARYRGRVMVRLIRADRADRWTDRRRRVECQGLDAIRRQGNRYWLNAHPAGAFCHAPAAPLSGREPEPGPEGEERE